MKNLLLSAFFLLTLVSCQKEEENPSRVLFELGKCFNGTVSGNFTMVHDDSNFDTNLYCGVSFSDTHFPLSEETCTWLSNYCCEEDKEFPYINESGEKIFLSIDDRKPSLMQFPTDASCENQPDKKITYYHYFEMASIYLKSSLSENRISLNVWPDYEDLLSENPKIGAHMRINLTSSMAFNVDSIGGGRGRGGNIGSEKFVQLVIPIDQSNINRPFPYDFQYLSEIEILGKTFFEVYTHEEDLKGSYTKIYYNKEYGIVSFVDETGVQWRLDQ